MMLGRILTRTLQGFPTKTRCRLHEKRVLRTNTIQDPSRRSVSSIIYADHYDASTVAVVDVELDLRTRFRNIDALHKNVQLRKLEDINAYHLASKHKTLRDVGEKKEELDSEREDIAQEMAQIVKKEETEARKLKKNQLIHRGKEVRNELKAVNRYYYDLEQEIMLLGLELPVDLHPDTPEEASKVERQHGVEPDMKHDYLSHITLGKQAGTIHQREIGPLKYYFSDELVWQEQDIIWAVTQKLCSIGLTQMSCPGIVKAISVEGSGLDINFPDRVYILKDKDIPGAHKDDLTWNITKYLSGVSPLGFASYITKMNIRESTLPQRYFSVGKNYNPSHNHQELGLFASPESMVLELCGLAKDTDQANILYTNFKDIVWDIYREIGSDLCLRMVNVSPPALALNESGRVDFQVWSPWLKKYITLGSVANCSDFLARRVMAKWSSNEEKVLPGQHLHTVHAAALNLTALVGIMMEAYQTDDGHYVFPSTKWQQNVPL